MTLYHGTSFKRGERIIKDKKISNTAEKIYKTGKKIFDTSDNLLFLTPSIFWALKFAFNAKFITEDDSDKIIIFKINDFNTDDLLIDHDEYNIEVKVWGNSMELRNGVDSLNNLLSACVDFPLHANKYNISYLEISTKQLDPKEASMLYNLEHDRVVKKQTLCDYNICLLNQKNEEFSKLSWIRV